MRFSNTSSRDSGGVLTEFVVVIPLLLVFFIGILGSGQLISNLTWISQATYIGAVSGSSIAGASAESTIQTNLERLRALQSHGQVDSGSNWTVRSTIAPGPLTSKPVIYVDVSAKVNKMMQAISNSNLGVGVVAPYLVPNQSQFAGYNVFANPAGVSGCTGIGCGGVVTLPGKPYLPSSIDFSDGLRVLDVMEEIGGRIAYSGGRKVLWGGTVPVGEEGSTSDFDYIEIK